MYYTANLKHLSETTSVYCKANANHHPSSLAWGHITILEIKPMYWNQSDFEQDFRDRHLISITSIRWYLRYLHP